jgi:hypothetical protein
MMIVQQIKFRASEAAFGKPLVTNVLRGLVAEAIVAAALEPDWKWCSEDYAAFDFLHREGLRLEVKQSAAKHSWAKEGARPSSVGFDIAARTGLWEDGVNWINPPGRNADIYVLAYHPVTDGSADHRDPHQWLFFVVLARDLPPSKRIGLASVRKLSTETTFNNLSRAVELARDELQPHEPKRA